MISALVRKLADLGASAEMIAVAVEAVEAARTEAEAAGADAMVKLEARRTSDRERKRKSRDRHGTVTAKEKSPIPPKENNPLPSSETKVSSEGISLAKQDRKEFVDWFYREWNSLAGSIGLAATRARTDRREAAILRRATDLVEALGYPDSKAGFLETFNKIRGSPLLRGENGRGWRCDLDWVLKEANLLKIHEGNYEKRTAVIHQFRR